MKNYLFLGLFSIFHFIIPSNTFATHISGADITYTCLGNNKYEFQATVYRDCAGNALSAPSLNFNSSNCNENFNIDLTQSGSGTDISGLCSSANSTCDNGPYPGREEFKYTAEVDLSSCSDWVITLVSPAINNVPCCRNDAINNMQVSGGSGGTSLYIESTLDNTSGVCNNSPQYAALPTPYMCTNQLFTYNHGAYDIDGDSIAFELVNALEGSLGSPTPIPFNPGYTVTEPVSTTNGFDFDPVTGQMCFTPSLAQFAVIAVKIKEYRKGRLIATHIREMQMIVENACNNAAPVIGGNGATCSELGTISNFFGGSTGTQVSKNVIILCPEDSISFDLIITDPNGDNLSVKSNINDALPGAHFDLNPIATDSMIGTFAWRPSLNEIGTHVFTVTIEDDACPIKAVQTFSYIINVGTATYAGPDQTICGNSALPSGQAVFNDVEGGSVITWSVLSGDPIVVGNNFSCNPCNNPIATPSVTTTYLVEGNQQLACKAKDTVTVFVATDFTYSLSTSDDKLCLQETPNILLTVNPNVAGYTFDWYLYDQLQSDHSQSPSIPFNIEGDHTLYVEINSPDGCVKWDSLEFTVSPEAQPDITIIGDTTLCEGNSSQLSVFNANNIRSCEYTLRLNDTSAFSDWKDPIGLFGDSEVEFYVEDTLVGIFSSSVTGIGFEEFSIKVRVGDTLYVKTTFSNAVSGLTYEIIDGEGNQVFVGGTSTATQISTWSGTANCGSAFKYQWNPSTALSSDKIANPVASPSVTPITYEVIITDSIGGCADTADITLNNVPDFSLSASQTRDTVCLFGENMLNASATGGANKYHYRWSPSNFFENDTLQNTIATYPLPGDQSVFLEVTSDSGCSKLDTFNVFVRNFLAPRVVITGDSTICNGDSVQLRAVNLNDVGSTGLNEDFEDQNIDSLLEISGGGLGVACGALGGDSVLFFDGPANTDRYVATKPLNTLFCNSINFGIFLGDALSDNAPLFGQNCAANVSTGNSVDFEYSIDNGNTWHLIRQYDENFWEVFNIYHSNLFGAGDWHDTSIVIPLHAKTENTIFRWNQPSHGGTGNDNWAVDNISLSCFSSGSFQHAWSPNIWIDDTTSLSPWITAPRDTTYTFVMGDPSSGCYDTANVNIKIVPVFNINTSQSHNTACLLEEVLLGATTDSSGSYTFNWSPAEIMNDDTASNPIAKFVDAGLNTVTVEMTSEGGCTIQKSIDVTVSAGVQPDITIVGDTLVCLGNSTQLTALNSAVINQFETNFDPHVDSLWFNYTGTPDSNDCIGSISGNAMLFDNDGVRELVTKDLNISNNGTITFDLFISNITTSNGCEKAETTDYVILSYSTDGGNIWNDMDTLFVEDFGSWSKAAVGIPNGALSPATQFRWEQPNHDGINTDNWAIDNISISLITVNHIYSWAPNIGVNDTTLMTVSITPPADQIYTVIVTDTVGLCADTADVFVNVVPTFTINTTQDKNAICLGASAQFTVNSPDLVGNATYTWNPGNISNDTANIVFNTPGVNTVYTNVTSDSGCTKIDSLTITVSENTPPIPVISGDLTVCENGKTQLLASNQTCSYQFILEGNNVITDGWGNSELRIFVEDTLNSTLTLPVGVAKDSFNIVFNNGDRIRVGYIGSVNSDDHSFMVNSEGNTLHADGPGPDTSIFWNNTVECTQGFDASAYDIEWKPTTWLNNASINNPTVTPLRDTTYTVIITDKVGGCKDSASAFVDVVPPVDFNILQDSLALCLEERVQVISTSTTPDLTYSWRGGDFDDPSSKMPLITFYNSGIDTIIADVTSAAGCTVSDTLIVTVSDGLRPQLSNITGGICEGTNGQLFVQNNASPSQPCDYTFNLFDNNPDNRGWEGSILNVYVNGVLRGLFDVSSGTSEIETLNVSHGDSLSIEYYALGADSSTNSFNIIDGEGNQVYTYPFGTTNDTIISMSVHCITPAMTAYTYNWSPGTYLNDSTIATPIITGTQDITYQVIVKDTVGMCADTAQVDITVVPEFNIQVTLDRDTVCLNENAILTATPSISGNFTYQWTSGGGESFSNPLADSTAVSYSSSGDKFIRIEIDNGGPSLACTQDTVIRLNVTPNAKPDITVDDVSICEGEDAVLIANNNATQGGSLSYSWSPATNLNVTDSQTVTSNTMVDMTYTVTVTDEAGGCSGTGSGSVTVNSTQNAQIDILQDSLCLENDPVTLSATPTGGTWSGSGVDANTGVFTPSIAGVGKKIITYSLQGGCGTEGRDSIYVLSGPNAPVVIGDTAYCVGDNFALTANDGTRWFLDAGLTNEIDDINTLNVTQSQIIYAVDTSAEGCLGDVTAYGITSIPIPTASFTDDYDGESSVPVLVNFDNTTSPGANTYTWNYGDGSPNSNVENGSHLYTTSGVYNVTLVASNDSLGKSCSNTVTRILDISNFNLFVPNVFSPNGDGENDVFKVRAEGLEEFSMIIYNRWGKKIYECGPSKNPDECTWDGGNNNEGTYFYVITATKAGGTEITDSDLEKDSSKLTGSVTLLKD